MKHHSHNRHPPSASTDGGHVPKWHIQSCNPGTRYRALRSVSLGGSERQGSGNTGWAAQAEGGRKVFCLPRSPAGSPSSITGSAVNALISIACLLLPERGLWISSTGRGIFTPPEFFCISSDTSGHLWETVYRPTFDNHIKRMHSKGLCLHKTVCFSSCSQSTCFFPLLLILKGRRNRIVLNCEMCSTAALKESTTQWLDIRFHGNQGPWALAHTAGNAADFHSSIFFTRNKSSMAIVNIWES